MSTGSKFAVTRCVCHDTSFEQLRDAGVKSIHEVSTFYGCTTKCGLCGPYIEEMLRTGQTVFPLDASESPEFV